MRNRKVINIQHSQQTNFISPWLSSTFQETDRDQKLGSKYSNNQENQHNKKINNTDRYYHEQKNKLYTEPLLRPYQKCQVKREVNDRSRTITQLKDYCKVLTVEDTSKITLKEMAKSCFSQQEKKKNYSIEVPCMHPYYNSLKKTHIVDLTKTLETNLHVFSKKVSPKRPSSGINRLLKIKQEIKAKQLKKFTQKREKTESYLSKCKTMQMKELSLNDSISLGRQFPKKRFDLLLKEFLEKL